MFMKNHTDYYEQTRSSFLCCIANVELCRTKKVSLNITYCIIKM